VARAAGRGKTSKKKSTTKKKPTTTRKATVVAANDYRRRPDAYCSQTLNVHLTPAQKQIARLLVKPPYKVLVRAGHNVGHSDAARTDVQFGLQWDRHRRALVPELVVLHLESEDAVTGANWSGRTTRPFGPTRASGAVALCPAPCS
jgi:hypothetical protein